MNPKHAVFAAIATTATVFCALPAFARPATLVAQDNCSRINVRSSPSTTAPSPHYGLAGDRVEITHSNMGRDGYQWFYVQFSSKAQGWVRGDFIRYTEGMAEYAVLGGKPGDRISVRSTPSVSAASPHFGIEGDVVRLVNQTVRNGYAWHYVEFPSGAKGWVRGDLVRPMDVGGC
jgi:hypothetical protein